MATSSNTAGFLLIQRNGHEKIVLMLNELQIMRGTHGKNMTRI